MVFKLANQNGASFIELLMVMGTIVILSATALVFYLGQLHKARSIVVVHDLRRFSGYAQIIYLAEGTLSFFQYWNDSNCNRTSNFHNCCYNT
ncbi:MAG: hypothetical protein KAJ62_08540 [Desulfobacteraceae bacterium]|nr:hypothetical protein [Desulfobacteraceae bacterium]